MNITTELNTQLSEALTMQVTCQNDDGMWPATVYFVHDDELNFYWLSLPSRRHSKAFENNPDAAAAIVLKADQPVVGIQARGTVALVIDPKVVELVMDRYIRKYDNGREFVQAFMQGTNDHQLYVFTPSHLELWDELRHPGSPQQVLIH